EVLARELPRRGRADREDADHLATRRQRHAEKRVLAVARERAGLGGHLPGEPLADLEGGPLLAAEGGARMELVAAQEKDVRGLGGEHLAQAHEEDVEQLVERQVRQGRLRDALEA